MARVTFGAATSRSPLLAAPPEMWGLLGERDRVSGRLRDGSGAPVTYKALLERAPSTMVSECDIDVFRAKHAAAQRAFHTVVDGLAAANPDVVVVMGDDEEEYIHDDLRPAITLYRGPTWLNRPRVVEPGDAIGAATAWQWGREERDYPVAAELTAHVLRSLIEAEFDVADSLTLEAMAHGFGFVFERMLAGRSVPIVPAILNVHTPPAQPTPKRCYDFGVAVRQAIEAWPGELEVAVVACGGLSVGVLEESLDRQALAAMEKRDVAAMNCLPRGWMQGSTGEVLCWIAAAGALSHLEMKVIDYIPAYRSPAGTGTGLAFATWQAAGLET